MDLLKLELKITYENLILIVSFIKKKLS